MTELHTLLSLYHKELVHTIRTPLAVVSNEVQFIELTSDVSNISKAKDKIGVIGDILKKLTEDFPEPDSVAELDLRELFQHLIFVKEFKGDSFSIEAFKNLSRRAFQLQSKVLEHLEPEIASVVLNANERTAILELESPTVKEMPEAKYFHDLHSLDVTLSRLEMIPVDIFFAASRIEFQLNVENGKLFLTYRFQS